ncbi:hypothetical protein QKU58_gp130 [Pyramimonas orientalis virus]|uniref:Uncharacterized protein n=1 Tax=Pyramimonas orientalis virus 01B TaxID=3134525 RepID=A0A7M3UNF0_9VIRU|nr:hypothetical protein QKU58_gp130 [Pyramimonas orientalis virus]QOI90201.1 hypothetical protein HWQ62_00064 [Pyramimonas orientalis virus]
MNLVRNNNLYDVNCIFEARQNLLMKDSVYQSSANVNLEGSFMVNKLQLTFFNPGADTYVKCDSSGNLIMDTVMNIPSWLRGEIANIDVTIFNNDVGALLYSDLSDVALTNSFLDLKNKPLLSKNVDVSVFCEISSNLADVTSTEKLFELGLDNVARCNLTPTVFLDEIRISELHLSKIINRSGLVSDTFNILRLQNIPSSTNDTHGIGILKAIPDSSTQFVAASYLNDKYNQLNATYQIKNYNYEQNVIAVNNYIAENSHLYTNFNCNLSDMETSVVVKHLELEKMLTQVVLENETVTLSDNLDVVFEKTTTQSYDLRFNPLIQHIDDTYGGRIGVGGRIIYDYDYMFMFTSGIDYLDNTVVPLTEYQTKLHIFEADNITSGFDRLNASNNIGLIKISPDFNSNNEFDTFDVALLEQENVKYYNQMEIVIRVELFQQYLDTLLATGVDGGCNMLKHSNNLSEIQSFDEDRLFLCYSNLELQKVAYSGNFDDLFYKPKVLSYFNNDIPYLDAYKNLSEYDTDEQKEICRRKLDVGTLGTQNTKNVEMSGEQLSMTSITVNSNFVFLGGDQGDFLKATTSEGNGILEKLPEFSKLANTVKGIVKMYNDVLVYDEEATYTIHLLKTQFDELEGYINEIKNALDIIDSEIQMQTN